MAVSSLFQNIKGVIVGQEASEEQPRGFAYDNDIKKTKSKKSKRPSKCSIHDKEGTSGMLEKGGTSNQNTGNSLIDDESKSDVIFWVGEDRDVQRITAHSWVLTENSPVFRAMFRSPLTKRNEDEEDPEPSSSSESKNLLFKSPRIKVAVSDVDGRAFDILLRYLYNETVNLQSVMTALTTLYAAHKYMCPGLSEIVVKYLKGNLDEKNVLLVLQHICLFCNALGNGSSAPITQTPKSASYTHKIRKKCDIFDSPSAPPLTEDDGDYSTGGGIEDEEEEEVGLLKEEMKPDCCEELLKRCLELIDEEAEVVLASEDIEDLDIHAFKLILSRDSLSVRSELDVFRALQRWSKRECKRQKLELTPFNKRKVSEGAQYLVRWLTLSEEDFRTGPYESGLLTEEERDAISAHLSSSGESPSSFPDHFRHCTQIVMNSPRRSKTASKKKDAKKRLRAGRKSCSLSSSSRKHGRQEKKKDLTVIANKDSSVSTQIKEKSNRHKDKFNIIEEFFICLACIFD